MCEVILGVVHCSGTQRERRHILALSFPADAQGSNGIFNVFNFPQENPEMCITTQSRWFLQDNASMLQQLLLWYAI